MPTAVLLETHDERASLVSSRPGASVRAESAAPVVSDNGRVLVVDDDDAVRRALVAVLRRDGQDVVDAGDATTALRWLTEQPFDAVVSDITMPGITGIEFLRAVRSSGLEVPVILITGNPQLSSAISAIDGGAFRYLSKPVELAELRSTVRRAIAQHRVARLKTEALAWTQQDHSETAELAVLGKSLTRAIAGMVPAFQPIVSWGDRRTIAWEALLRSPEPALADPEAVLSAATRLGRLDEVGRAVRRLAAGVVGSMDASASMFVNLHPLDLCDDELYAPCSPLSRVAGRVVLEITERASLDAVAEMPARLAALRGLGYRVAIDDLGSGYSGLNALASLAPDYVKLDMGLVRGIDRDASRRHIVRSVLGLARTLGVHAVCEGVETACERDALLACGADLMQGYLFGRPAPQLAVGRLQAPGAHRL